ncbi:hypothetical protein M9458_014695, partial [Cirrhinus mrigala]
LLSLELCLLYSHLSNKVVAHGSHVSRSVTDPVTENFGIFGIFAISGIFVDGPRDSTPDYIGVISASLNAISSPATTGSSHRPHGTVIEGVARLTANSSVHATPRDHATTRSSIGRHRPASRFPGEVQWFTSKTGLEWATAVWRLDRPTFPSFSDFLQRFKEVFQPSTENGEAGEQIMALQQGRRTAADYALSFRTLAAQSGWNDGPLKLHYRKGLHPDLQLELACRDEGLTLEQYIDLSIRVDNVMQARKSSRLFTPVPLTAPTSEAAPEPMQIGATKLSLEERERWLRGNLCLYCGQPGLPVLSCSSHVTVAALDGRPLGSGKIHHTTNDLTLRIEPCHLETIRFFVISSPHSPIILGYPWLNLHGPTIAWANCTISHWSPRCQEHCLQPKIRGRIFPLSQAESAAMNTYIQEELAKGFIRPSTSPASAGFFFVKKKDGDLRPCIDYRGLNEITIKYRYPLPLVPSALEQLRTAKIFTKLDLCSAYNLIRICAGDEWKIAFSTTSGHYEYRVMPFGLVNSPSFFQAFINEVFRDMLNRWVIVYTDDILIYSNSYTEHVKHVRAVLQRLIAHQLYAKEEKCEFHLDKISFLGYVISSEGVAMDERKAPFAKGTKGTKGETILPTSMIVAPVTWDIMTEISEAQAQDPTPADCPDNLVYVPLSLRPRVLAEVHTTPSSGHPGIEATLHLLSNRFWWPTQRTDTVEFIKRCTVCNITKVPHRLPAGLLQPLPVPQRLWSHIAVDFITDLPPSNGYTTILSVVDRFSKGCCFIPLAKLPTAMETAELLCNWVFRFYGLPEDIVSDRGPQFSSHLWSSFFRLLGVNMSLTSGYHPQANGQVERLNQELTRFLHSYCHDRQEDWSRYLFWAEYAQNSLRKPTTHLTPFQCILGFQPPLFPWSREPSELPAVNSWFQQSEETWSQAHVHLQRAIRRTQTQANRRRQPNPPTSPGNGCGSRSGTFDYACPAENSVP